MAASSASEETPLLPEQERPDVPWREFAAMVGIASFDAFMYSLMYTSIVPLLPFYAKEYHLTAVDQGRVLASLPIGFCCGAMLLNSFARFIHPRLFVLFGGIGYAVGPSIIAYDPGLNNMMVGRFIEGIAGSWLLIHMDSMLARRLPTQQKGRAFGFKAAIGTCGLFFGPVVGGVLFVVGGIKLPMQIIACVGCLGLLVYFFVLPNWFDERWENLHPDEWYDAQNEPPAPNALFAFRGLWRGTGVVTRYRHFFADRILLIIMILQLLTYIMLGIFFLILPDFLEDYYKVTTLELSLMWVCWDFMKVMGGIIGGYTSDKGSAWCMALLGLVIQSFTMMVVSDILGTTFYKFVFTCGIVLSLGTTTDGFIGGPFYKLISEVERQVGQSRYEELFSISHCTLNLGLLIGTSYAGQVYDSLGFQLTVYSFAWIQLFTIVACGYAVVDHVRHLFETDPESRKRRLGQPQEDEEDGGLSVNTPAKASSFGAGFSQRDE